MSKRTALQISALVAIAALAACRPPPEQQAALPAVNAQAATHAPFSVNELMVMIIDQPGELLWNVEKDGRAPKTDEDWYQLENHAVALASAATLVKLGGTGPNDMGWSREAVWQTSSEQLVTAALNARQAASKKDFDALVKANGEIVDACNACHKQFKPNIPTGGLFMHQPPKAG
jgi:hypothetical protein